MKDRCSRRARGHRRRVRQRPSLSSISTMRVVRRGTRRAKRSSSRLSGTLRAHSRWLREKISSSRTSISASSPPSPSMALTAAGATGEASLSTRCADSRRLLCVHLLDRAGLQIDLDAVDLVEIGAGDADEARVVGIVDRVNGAVLVDAGFARREPVFLGRLELGVLGVLAVVLALPIRSCRCISSPGRRSPRRRRDRAAARCAPCR